MTDEQLYRFSTDAEDEEWRHSSPKGVLRLYDDYGEFNGCMVRVEPDYEAAETVLEHTNFSSAIVRLIVDTAFGIATPITWRCDPDE